MNAPGKIEPALNVRLYITSITQQRNGAMWFGTNGYGVLHYAGDTLTYLSAKEGFMSKHVYEMLEDASGNLWFATADGLICRKAGTGLHSFTLFTEKEGLPHKDVRSLALDRKGMLWVGTTRGIARVDTKQMSGNIGATALPFLLPENDEPVHSIMVDRKGSVWIGGNHGVLVYDGTAIKPFRQLNAIDGLCGDTVRDIIEDRHGDIWFATQHGGVCRMDDGLGTGKQPLKFTHMATKAGHHGTEVAHLYEDVFGRIWFSVNGVGTYCWEGGSLNPYFESQSCNSHTFNSTFQDKLGRIWFGGWLGLFYYHEPC